MRVPVDILDEAMLELVKLFGGQIWRGGNSALRLGSKLNFSPSSRACEFIVYSYIPTSIYYDDETQILIRLVICIALHPIESILIFQSSRCPGQ